MGSVIKNHFNMSAGDYYRGALSGRYDVRWPQNLKLEQIPATIENYEPLVKLLGQKWGWDKQARYQGESLQAKLNDPQAALYLLKDDGRAVGYAFASSPSSKIKDRFFANASVVEIENLGMFPGEEGGGRGKKYFEMLFAEYFPDMDNVYWSQHETHFPTLKRFYQEKMGMQLLAQETVPDFRVHEPA